MAMPEATEPTKTISENRKCGSPYFAVKIAAGALAALSVCYAILGPLTGTYVISDIEFCLPVEPGEPHHLILDGMRCRITSTSWLYFAGAFAITSIALQIPALILWAILAYRERWRKRPSPYRPVKILGIAMFGLAFCWVAAAAYVGFVNNSGQEYCDYVGPGEPYHLVIYDTPCRITWTAVRELFLFLIATNIPLQSPTLILWAVLRERRQRERRRATSENGPTAGRDIATER